MLATGWTQRDQGVWPNKKTYYYLRVKNSLASSWGDKGYAYILYQTDDKITDECGILKESYFPYG
jgi:C1A family cysteine protease